MKEEIKNIIEATSMGKLEKEAVLNSLLNLHSVSEISLEDKLYNKCLESMPNITKEEFEEALNTWLHQYTKSKQIENFNPHSC